MPDEIIDEGTRAKKMADALKRGFKMLGDTCPRCGTPLFQKPNGEVVCVYCGIPVILVSSEEEAEEQKVRMRLIGIRDALSSKLEEMLRDFYPRESSITMSASIKEISEALLTVQKIIERLSRKGEEEKRSRH
jgi:uncharacterized Zn finger protein (UPF0148 family)